MNDIRTAAQQLLDASDQGHDIRHCLTALRAALAQQAEPVAWMHKRYYLLGHAENMPPADKALAQGWVPLYTAPPAAQQAEPVCSNTYGCQCPKHYSSAQKTEPVAEPKYTTGHCTEKAKPGGCQLHNLQCGYPQCDRKPADPEAQQAEPVLMLNGMTQEETAATASVSGLTQQAEPVAWLDDSGHPKHRLYRQSATEQRLYGPLRPLYTAPPDDHEVQRLRSQRDALLGALRMFVEHGTCFDDQDMAAAHAAIKAVEEGE